MNQQEWQAEQFEAQRSRMRAVAYRMLGSLSEAEDAVQEAWLHMRVTVHKKEFCTFRKSIALEGHAFSVRGATVTR